MKNEVRTSTDEKCWENIFPPKGFLNYNVRQQNCKENVRLRNPESKEHGGEKKQRKTELTEIRMMEINFILHIKCHHLTILKS